MTRYIIFLLICLVLTSAPLKAYAKSIQVCADCEYKTLAKAILDSTNGDNITLKKGIYREHEIQVDKSLSIHGEKGAVIDGTNQGTIIKITADDVTLSGLTFKNVGQSYIKDFAAILVHRSKNFTIKNNTLENVFFGILVEKSKGGIISNNTISGQRRTEASSGNGIHLWHSSDVKVENNELFGLRDGIYFEFVSNSTIAKNRSHNNIRYGLHFMFSNNDDYEDNSFYENGAGVAVMFSKFITMKRNTFRNNWGSASYGLLLKEIYDAEIVNNIFRKNTIAIYTEGSTRVNYIKNTFDSNGWAVKVAGACYTNIYRDNNFLYNSFDVSYNSKVNDNKFEHNYWSSYTGYDLDNDKVGDVPHRPVKLFSYIANRTPETIVLLRSLFVDIINFSEKVSPIFTPDDIVDERPAMREHV